MERRLSAIMSADVVGYSRLMGANEVATLDALNDRRTTILEPAIGRYNGRVVKLTGDGLLAEFTSVVSAVECGTAIQAEMSVRNHDVPEDRRIDMRIGINLGDVIAQEGDIYGAGVNLAARIEGVARPGRVAVSQSVRDHVGNRLEVQFEDRGEHDLKNIDQPIRVFEVVPEGDESFGAGRSTGDIQSPQLKPSIAVLPFDNMSGDPEQDYFSDGITEDLITDLSKISALFVVGRHTSFGYKGKSQNLGKVAAELGVRYLLEGSVRKADNRVRITGQLIDGMTGGHVWADRFDRDLTDIFLIQDEITHAIVDQLRVHLVPEEREAIGQAPTGNIEAYNYYLKGRQFFHNATKANVWLAREMFTRATELDPGFAKAHAGIAISDSRLVGWYGESLSDEAMLAPAEKALSLDPNLAEAHAARGEALCLLGRNTDAEAEFEEAIRLDPNSFEANFLYARYWKIRGEPEKAIVYYIRALEVQPDDPQAPLLVHSELRAVGRFQEADDYARMGLRRAEEALRQHPEWSRPAQLAAGGLAGMGEHAEAIRWLERALAVDPDDNVAQYNVACTWAMLGEADRAMDLLHRWFPKSGVEKRMWLQHDSDFDAIREDPRFQKLLQEAARPQKR